MRSYSELMQIDNFLDRFRYLKLGGKVGQETFGAERYMNQIFYTSPEWKKIRNEVIIRDLGCDLGIEDREIGKRVYIHHMNPITMQDIRLRSDTIMDPEYLICCSFNTHNAIHYGSEDLLVLDPIERKPFDTCPWRN